MAGDLSCSTSVPRVPRLFHVCSTFYSFGINGFHVFHVFCSTILWRSVHIYAEHPLVAFGRRAYICAAGFLRGRRGTLEKLIQTIYNQLILNTVDGGSGQNETWNKDVEHVEHSHDLGLTSKARAHTCTYVQKKTWTTWT